MRLRRPRDAACVELIRVYIGGERKREIDDAVKGEWNGINDLNFNYYVRLFCKISKQFSKFRYTSNRFNQNFATKFIRTIQLTKDKEFTYVVQEAKKERASESG